MNEWALLRMDGREVCKLIGAKVQVAV
jgi:hypothetical protein